MSIQFHHAAQSTFDDLIRELDVTRQGLNEAEATHRRSIFGTNRFETSTAAWPRIVARQFRSPFLFILFGAAILSFAFGQSIDGILIAVFILINATIGFYQEYHSEKTAQVLKSIIQPRARVLREGKETMIESHQVVPGDIMVLEPGDILSADIRLQSEADLQIDESVLTGESAPAQKNGTAMQDPPRDAYQASNIAFCGTTVVNGKSMGVVFATGQHTTFGSLAHLATQTQQQSIFEKGINRFSAFILKLILATLVVVFAANIAIKGSDAHIGELLIFCIALAVSVIPEALPVVMTFSLSRGAMRLARHKVVVKRLSAVEDMGSIEILCTDKTGTLTENKLTVSDTYQAKTMPDVALLAAMASRSTTAQKEPRNAFDQALWNFLPATVRQQVSNAQAIWNVPFDPIRRRATVLVQNDESNFMISLGAPENIFALCPNLAQDEQRAAETWVQKQGSLGNRVLGVSYKVIADTNAGTPNDERDMQFVGIVAFHDPLKASSADAVQRAQSLGLRIVIVTGDSPEVARTVAQQVHLLREHESVITGEQLDALSASEQLAAVEHASVFARVSPEQKYAIIALLQQHHDVGFLGEGINDAPALKLANIGIVVQSAADVSREAADVMLMEKSLSVIVDGIREGREVFANTTKYIKATLASNFGNFYTIAAASLFLQFLPMLPIQILLVNLLSDFPMIAIAADAVEPSDIAAPRRYDVKSIAAIATTLGLVSTLFDFIFLGFFVHKPPHVLQTAWFLESILTELLFIFSIRTRQFIFRAAPPAKSLVWLSATAFFATLLLPFLPLSHTLFHLVALSKTEIFTVLMIIVSYITATEIVKILYYRFFSPERPRTLLSPSAQ